MINDFGYYQSIIKNLELVNATQGENIQRAASLMCEAIANDRLIHVYGGGGHTTLPVGEMFFRATSGLRRLVLLGDDAITITQAERGYVTICGVRKEVENARFRIEGLVNRSNM